MSSYKQRHYAAKSFLDFIYGIGLFGGYNFAADVGNHLHRAAFVSELVDSLQKRLV